MLTRRSMILAAAGIAAIPASLAQRPRGGAMGGARMVEAMKERLNLSEEQVEKLKKIYDSQAAKLRELRENAPEDGRPSREEMAKLRENTNKQVMEVLSKEQQEEYKKMQEEMMERIRERRGGRGGPPQQ